jgi:hypothetical protein
MGYLVGSEEIRYLPPIVALSTCIPSKDAGAEAAN